MDPLSFPFKPTSKTERSKNRKLSLKTTERAPKNVTCISTGSAPRETLASLLLAAEIAGPVGRGRADLATKLGGQ